jgi:hypothetical protein
MKKVWSRRSAITSVLIGKTVLIHNGKEFKKLLVKREHLGFKFGEFSLTKKFTKKNGDKKNKIWLFACGFNKNQQDSLQVSSGDEEILAYTMIRYNKRVIF